jgi:light-regulated signal transduction histidine kinase (bacteriophytochrome)
METRHAAPGPDLSLCELEPIHTPGAIQVVTARNTLSAPETTSGPSFGYS